MKNKSAPAKAMAAILALAAGMSVFAEAAQANCSVYQHRDYQGARWTLRSGSMLAGVAQPANVRGGCTGPGCATVHWQPAWNDQISSFRVAKNCEISLHQHIDASVYPPRGYGMMWRANSNFKFVGSQWNDQTSLVTCTCR